MHATTELLSTVVISLAVGTAVLVLAARLKFPSIALLLVAGIAVGPDGAGWVHPEVLGAGFEPLIGLAVAVILFEGGLTLNLDGFRSAPRVIRRLVTTGAVVTWLGTATLAYLLLEISLPMALLLGSLVIVTGPTVVTPLLRRIGVVERLHHILHWEAVLIDPIGVFIALLCYELFEAGGSRFGPLGAFGVRVAVGLVVGVGGGIVIGWLLQRRWIPRSHANISVLASALFLYGVSDLALPHTGLLSVTVAGLLLGWRKPPQLAGVKTFKLQVTELAISFVFILLAANLDLNAFVHLGGTGYLLIALLILVIRPLVVVVATWGESLGLRERAFMSWIAPRGIVAASMASLFGAELVASQIPGAELVEAFTFSVIAVTVLLQGASSGVVARLLRVKQPERTTWLIIGARTIGIRIARALADNEVDCVVVDRDEDAVAEASRRGLRAFAADALDLELPNDPRLSTVGAVLCATNNERFNAVIASRWAEELGDEQVFSWGALCSGGALGQSATLVDSDDSLRQPARVNRGLDDGALELITLPPQTPVEHGRTLLTVRDRRATARLSGAGPAATTKIVLRWRPIAEADVMVDAVLFDETPADRLSLFSALVDRLAEHVDGLDREETTTALVRRQEIAPMDIGQGITIPHLPSPIVDESVGVIGTIKEGFGRGAPDGQPLRIVFLVLSPQHRPELHLDTLAAIARWAAHADRIERLVHASSPLEACAQVNSFIALYPPTGRNVSES